MDQKFTVEKLTQIWFDDCGERIEIGPDSDCLGLVEIRHKDKEGKAYPGARITLSPQMAKALAQAILECAENLLAIEREQRSMDLTGYEKELIDNGKWIEAIKAFRDRNNKCELKIAKDVVDRYRNKV